jgi:hypothetical protein
MSDSFILHPVAERRRSGGDAARSLPLPGPFASNVL